LHSLEIKTLSEIKSEKNSAISSAFSDVIREFLIKNHLEFDLIILREATGHINSVINEIMKQLNGKFPCQIRFIASVDDWDHKLYKSAIFFMPTLEDLKNFHSRSITNEFEKQLNHFFPLKLKFLIYVEELKEITDLADHVKIMLRPIACQLSSLARKMWKIRLDLTQQIQKEQPNMDQRFE
jgi:predicted CopG family antitoxin